MAAEEDNFDIDIYGDGEGDMGNEGNMDYKEDEEDEEVDFGLGQDDSAPYEEPVAKTEQASTSQTAPQLQPEPTASETPSQDQVKSDDVTTNKPHAIPVKPNPAPQQGTKRKESSDERMIDAGATNALMLSDLHWWTTEDDIRAWANDAGAEDELKDVTYSEHKVNGKSKGQAYIEFTSPQAATATKHTIEAVGDNQPASRKHSVVFTNPMQNPFKTLPKDAPARARDERPVRGGSASYNSAPHSQNNYGGNNQGYRGGRGGGFNRGSYNAHGGAHNQYNNRNFSGPMGGYNNNNNNNSGSFQGNMNMNNGYVGGGGFNRGAMMNNSMRGGNMGPMRGGRGGMNNMMQMGGGMNMGNMGMNPMMAGMGMGGFQGNHFNPGMFNSGQGSNFGNGDWNQHGAKRQRQE